MKIFLVETGRPDGEQFIRGTVAVTVDAENLEQARKKASMAALTVGQWIEDEEWLRVSGDGQEVRIPPRHTA